MATFLPPFSTTSALSNRPTPAFPNKDHSTKDPASISLQFPNGSLVNIDSAVYSCINGALDEVNLISKSNKISVFEVF